WASPERWRRPALSPACSSASPRPILRLSRESSSSSLERRSSRAGCRPGGRRGWSPRGRWRRDVLKPRKAHYLLREGLFPSGKGVLTMAWWRRIFIRLRSRKKQDGELPGYVEEWIRELIDEGIEPEAAREEALRSFSLKGYPPICMKLSRLP